MERRTRTSSGSEPRQRKKGSLIVNNLTSLGVY
jgi:hypothetical protein